MRGPRAIQAVETQNNGVVLVNKDSLMDILLDPLVADKKVVVISVAGVYRSGKSFLLNFIIMYLEARMSYEKRKKEEMRENSTNKKKNKKKNDKLDWMIGNGALKGFEWRKGEDAVTTGIQIWSKVFVVEDKYGEEVAVVLMDTQGTFDCSSSNEVSTAIFALSALLSSIQVYNLNRQIGKDDIDNLAYFISYASVLSKKEAGKEFQNLVFLIRDFPHGRFPFGADGGLQYLADRTQTSKCTNEMLKVMSSVRDSYEKVCCELFPFCGLNAASYNTNKFDGKLQELDSLFLNHLRAFVEVTLFGPGGFAVKKIRGAEVTCGGLYQYLKSFTGAFKETGIPQPQSMFAALVTGHNNNILQECIALYVKKMSLECSSFLPFYYHWNVQQSHEKVQVEVRSKFEKANKLGGEEAARDLTERLNKAIDVRFEDYKRRMNFVNEAAKKGVSIAFHVALSVSAGILQGLIKSGFSSPM